MRYAFGFGSGGGVIFGVTGGVTEAVLRRLSPDHTKETMREIAECGVRGDEGIKEFTIPYKGMDINVCVASGLANARTVMERVKNGEANYHLIEVMACRRGCIMGGGQPVRAGDRTKAARARGLYKRRQYHADQEIRREPYGYGTLPGTAQGQGA